MRKLLENRESFSVTHLYELDIKDEGLNHVYHLSERFIVKLPATGRARGGK
jgi:hypothetical protein